MPEGTKMSNGPPPARPDGTVDDARWLFPQERAPPPHDEGCKQNGFGDPAPHLSNGSPPTPSPPPTIRGPSSASTASVEFLRSMAVRTSKILADSQRLVADSQRLLDEHTACARQQEAARQGAASAAQRFVQECAALERQQGEAAHRQRLLDEETARLRRAAQAQQTAAAGVIFLWLRRRHLFARLARQTSRRLQHEAALARLQHEQECCARAALAEAQRQQKLAARMKAFADEAGKRRRQVLAAATLADEQLCRGENERSPPATAAIVAAERVDREVAERTSRLATLALVVEQERREAAECALALATTALAAALKRQEAAERTPAMDILMLANVRKRQQAAKRAQMTANMVRSFSPTLPHPMSYVGAILSTIRGDCQPSSQVLQSTTANESAAITLHKTARRRKRPRRRPGCRNVPRAPNPLDQLACGGRHRPRASNQSTGWALA